MTLRLALSLPRDAATVPVARRLLSQALTTLGVAEDCRDDICLILTEACTNVIDHARATAEYEISAGFVADQCVIEVINAGAVVDRTRLVAAADPLADRGRGLPIMRALADELQVSPADGGGVVLRAATTLRWRTEAPAWARSR